MAQTFVLITGGSRGIGSSLVARFLAQPNHTVIAANRDPEGSSSKDLANFPKGDGTKLIVAKYDASIEQDAANLVTELREKHGIDRLDIVVANAGIMTQFPLVKDVTRPRIVEHLQVNTFAVVSLYQATRELLQRSSREPIFTTVGSGAASLSNQPPFPNAAYGPSKVLINWYTVKINAEDEWLNAFVLEPGFVHTDGAATSAEMLGLPFEALSPLEDASAGLVKVISNATKEKVGGRVVSPNGEVQPW